MKRVRLDDELIAQGICADRADALRTCMAGLVSSGGERLTSPGMKVLPGIDLHVKGKCPFVGRGGFKLQGALDAFGIDVRDLTCADIGCSTGGFTDCLLQHGARKVVSVDVGRAQFDWSLRNDERVELLERTNVVDLPGLGYADTVDLAVCDVSFTSIERIIDAVIELLADDGAFCTLVKPQFEALPEEVGDGGVVRDAAVRHRVLERNIELFRDRGLCPLDVCVSPIHGAKGNVEYFLYGCMEASSLARGVDIVDRVEALKRKAGKL